ncbi:MAG: S-methyl-5'-thioadenosine phosphorylase [Phycisphaerae bacterium]|nr:S-methyl-5'-thioadenosine phosphorylase [Phycisphaerae bacterium]
MADRIIGVIGGTGLGQALLAEVSGERCEVDTPFGRPSAPIVRTRWEGIEIAFLPRHGEGHTFCPSAVPYRANIYALKALGVTSVIASGATGSLREEIRPRDLVVVDQVVDKTTRRASSFFDEPGIAVHVELSNPFCPDLRRTLLSAAESVDVTVHDGGTYVCMEGPAFSTVAESQMHRSWGGDLIGMTCMPEAKLAREAEMCYALIALPTDYDCWRPHDTSMDKQALLAEIIGNVEAATANCVSLMKAALRAMAEQERAGAHPVRCACQDALDLAIWTNREGISPETVERYGVLLSRIRLSCDDC